MLSLTTEAKALSSLTVNGSEPRHAYSRRAGTATLSELVLCTFQTNQALTVCRCHHVAGGKLIPQVWAEKLHVKLRHLTSS